MKVTCKNGHVWIETSVEDPNFNLTKIECPECRCDEVQWAYDVKVVVAMAMV